MSEKPKRIKLKIEHHKPEPKRIKLKIEHHKPEPKRFEFKIEREENIIPPPPLDLPEEEPDAEA